MGKHDFITEVKPRNIDHIEHVEKFNPFHDRRGRFTSANGFMSSGYAGDKDRQAVTFSANPKTRAGAMAIARHSNGETGHEIIGQAHGGKPKIPEKQTKPKAPEKNESTEYKTLSKEDVKRIQSKMPPPITAEDKAELTGNGAAKGFFQTWHSFEINRALRNGTLEDEGYRVKDAVKRMDRNMRPLPENIKVTRFSGESLLQSFGVDPAKMNDSEYMKKALTGKTHTEKGFMSTSYDTSENVFTSHPIKMNMNVPKGAKGMVSPTGAEAEIVLARNTKYTIKNVKVNNGQIELDIDVAA